MSLITQKPNYNISDGIKRFDSVQAEGNNAVITIIYENIDTADVELFIEQSVDGSNWPELEGSRKVVDQTKDHHTYNVIGLVKGLLIRIGVDPKTAATGTITEIKHLI
jgi:hypothetical protein